MGEGDKVSFGGTANSVGMMDDRGGWVRSWVDVEVPEASWLVAVSSED